VRLINMAAVSSPTSAAAAVSAPSSAGGSANKIIRPAPAEIEYKAMRFLITEQPQDATLANYAKILKEHRVTHLVCATDPTYRTDDLGVRFTELAFADGSPPPAEIVEKWLTLVASEFASSSAAEDVEKCVGVHGVTGRGRAPVLVAVALIELGMKYEDAVEEIRRKRRGAINSRQLEFLAKYKRRKAFSARGGAKNKCCVQ